MSGRKDADRYVKIRIHVVYFSQYEEARNDDTAKGRTIVNKANF